MGAAFRLVEVTVLFGEGKEVFPVSAEVTELLFFQAAVLPKFRATLVSDGIARNVERRNLFRVPFFPSGRDGPAAKLMEVARKTHICVLWCPCLMALIPGHDLLLSRIICVHVSISS